MKRHTKIFIGVAGTLAIVGGIAFAGTQVMAKGMGGMGGSHRMEMIEQIDANADGKITMAEMNAHREQLHAEHDKDGNKAISLSEFEGIWLTMMRPMMVDKFQMMDDDGDGQITDAEVDKKMTRMMRWMDKDEDGALSIKEMYRGHKKFKRHHDDDDDDHGRRYKDKS
mgnify:CR=1 FL=1